MSENGSLAVVVLAAGKGKRMKSEMPKVLHRVCGRTLVEHVLSAVDGLGAGEVVVVVGHGGDSVQGLLGERHFVVQEQQNGTGHAVQVAMQEVAGGFDEVLVLPGDSPLVRTETLEGLVEARRSARAAAAMLSSRLEDPSGYGRVVRGPSGEVARIVEEADATAAEKELDEVNACTYSFDRALLEPALALLDTDNAQGEYYLTSVVERFAAGEEKVVAVQAPAEEVLGINDRSQLADAATVMRRRINGSLMAEGVTIVDPATTYIDSGIAVGPDTVIMPMVFVSGDSRVGSGCRIGPCTTMKDTSVGDGCSIEYAWMDGCTVADDVAVGPYTRLRPGTRLEAGSKAGSFVEMKKTIVGTGSKVPHLSYIGDAVIGRDVNVGAGSITCNYDGENKYPTVIGDGAFIGSDTMLIAPVEIGANAVTAAGSAITEDVPDGGLGVERSKQENIHGYREKKRAKRTRREAGGTEE